MADFDVTVGQGIGDNVGHKSSTDEKENEQFDTVIDSEDNLDDLQVTDHAVEVMQADSATVEMEQTGGKTESDTQQFHTDVHQSQDGKIQQNVTTTSEATDTVLKGLRKSLSSFAGHVTGKQKEVLGMLHKAENLPWVKQAMIGCEDAYSKYLKCHEEVMKSIPNSEQAEIVRAGVAHQKRKEQQTKVRNQVYTWIDSTNNLLKSGIQPEQIDDNQQNVLIDKLESASTTGQVSDEEEVTHGIASSLPGVKQAFKLPSQPLPLISTAKSTKSQKSKCSHKSVKSYKSKASNKSHKSKGSESHCSSKSGGSAYSQLQEELIREEIRLEEMLAIQSKWEEEKQLAAKQEKVKYEMEIVRLAARQKAAAKAMQKVKLPAKEEISQGKSADTEEEEVFEMEECNNEKLKSENKSDEKLCIGTNVITVQGETKTRSQSTGTWIVQENDRASTPRPDNKEEAVMKARSSSASQVADRGKSAILETDDWEDEGFQKCIQVINEQLNKLKMNRSGRGSAETSTISGINPESKEKMSQLNPKAAEWQPLNKEASEDKDVEGSVERYSQDTITLVQKQILESNRELAAAVLFPPSSLQKFSGDPLEYRAFKMRFEARVNNRVSRILDKLQILQDSLEGKAKEVINMVKNTDPTKEYQMKWQALEKRYGQSQFISNAYYSKLMAWKPVQHDDDEGLKKLAAFMTECVNAMMELPDLYLINTPSLIAQMMNKLPMLVQNKWRESVRRLEKNGRVPGFADLTETVVEVSEMIDHPLYGRHVVRTSRSQPVVADLMQSSKPRTQQASSFAVNEEIIKVEVHLCVGCHGEHDIEDCSNYTTKTLEERKAFIIEKKLCFACLRPGHISKQCINRRICRSCSKRHPTSLHEDRSPTQVQQANANHVVSEVEQGSAQVLCGSVDRRGTVYHAVIPVLLKRKGLDKTVRTYCFLDGGSGASFLNEDLCAELGATGLETTLKLKTLHGSSLNSSQVIADLVVSDLYGRVSMELDKVFTRPSLDIDTGCVPRLNELKQWPHLKEATSQMYDFFPDLSVGLLIGNNCPLVMQPQSIIPAGDSGLYGVRTPLGWTVQGVVPGGRIDEVTMVNRAAVAEVEGLREMVLALYDQEFIDTSKAAQSGEKDLSEEDRKFVDIVSTGIRHDGTRYTVPLPFRNPNTIFPNNRLLAEKRALSQKNKMKRDPEYHEEYTAFVQKMLQNGHARLLEDCETGRSGERNWFIPHHGIRHPVKKKPRVVYDCSARLGPVSLNGSLLQGPNFTNTVTGVLNRFRLHDVAFVADIESMYYQVRVPREDQLSLKFLWWPEGDLSKELKEYCMTSHVFGSISSPSIAIFALNQAARDFATTEDVKSTVAKNFYVDDLLKSCATELQAVTLAEDVRECCIKAGFRLTKFASNSTAVINSVPEEDRVAKGSTCTLEAEERAIERTLGMCWDTVEDVLKFNISVKERQFTRRGVLSTIASVYDPLGVLAPFILPAKRLLQQLCKSAKVGWDDTLPMDQYKAWQEWLEMLPVLNNLKVKRSFGMNGGSSEKLELAVCADASLIGYSAAAYVRVKSENHSSGWHFVMGKARVAPAKGVATVPRLELAAAVSAIQLAGAVQVNFDKEMSVRYYTDSEAVIRFLASEQQRLVMYISNRVRAIKAASTLEQWWHIKSEDNPADLGSRGMSAAALIRDNLWLKGPTDTALKRCRNATLFIPKLEVEQCCATDILPCETKVTVMDMLRYHSRWSRVIRVIIYWRKFFTWLRLRARGLLTEHIILLRVIYVSEITEAERTIVTLVQKDWFKRDIEQLREGNHVLQSSSIRKLNPVLWDDLIRVGERLKNSDLSFDLQHPIILPGRDHLTRLLIKEVHERLGHVGRSHTLSHLRLKYWILGGLSTVRNVLHPCVLCRRLYGHCGAQLMSDFPQERVTSAAPFSFVGIDYFGPFIIKERRTELKRYGVMFTCLCLRSTHCEVSHSLETDSFILAMRRFIARRGKVVKFFSDNGTNFVGANAELKRALEELDQGKIQKELADKKIEWAFNPPHASHMGGAWERLIRSARRILDSLMTTAQGRLNDESFRTLMCEVEGIMNSRPLTAVTQDPAAPIPLSPEQVLTFKVGSASSMPGVFPKQDLYAQKQWRRVQRLAVLFWQRWHTEYLVTLQERGKWQRKKRNIRVGDLVMAQEDNMARGDWPVGVVVSANVGDDGLVHHVTFRTVKRALVERAIHKIVLLVPEDAALEEGKETCADPSADRRADTPANPSADPSTDPPADPRGHRGQDFSPTASITKDTSPPVPLHVQNIYPIYKSSYYISRFMDKV